MLSFMAKGFFSQSPVLFYPLVALFIFMVIFTLVSFRALRKNKSELSHIAALPLCDDTGAPGADHE